MSAVQAPAPAPVRPRTPRGSVGWVTAVHALPLVTSWLGPLVVLLTRGERDVAVRDAACEALNVEITWALVALVLALVLPGLIGVGAVLLVLVVRLAFFLWAMVRAGDGWAVRYPVSLRIVR